MKKRLIALLLTFLTLFSSAGALTVEQARELVNKLYIDEAPEEILNRATVEEIFEGLDQYSAYMNPEQYQAFLNSMNDVSQVGLGIVSQMNEAKTALEIVKVYPGGAAEAAGVKAGDLLLSIDGRKVSDAPDMAVITGWMRGEEGTRVTLVLKRAGGKTETVTVIRAPFTIPYTEHELLDGHIGYIACDSFGMETYDHFVEALDDMEAEADKWIVDIRGNTGGVTQAAADVAGIFNGPGIQAILEERGPEYFAFAAERERTTLYPVILLVDEYSASSSELLAAAIRDRGSGLILGSRTFGKGVAQTIVDLETEPTYFAEGDAVKITSARFYSVNGVVNQNIGVLPHLLVDDEYAGNIAYLLSAKDPLNNNKDYLRIHAGSWRWYVSLEQALRAEDGAYRPAFVELLEALWPDATVYAGAGGGRWEEMNAADLAMIYHLDDYTPRTFADAGDSVYEYDLNVLGAYGILRGDEQGNVAPEGELTRAELCAMLAQTLNTDKHTWPSHFPDVPEDAWYASAVNAMAELGLVSGDETGAFHPEQTLTEEQMVVILSRLATYLNADFKLTAMNAPEGEGLMHTYTLSYSPWAWESAWLMGLSRKNIFDQYISYVYTDIQKTEPQAPATREKAAASLFRVLNLLGGLEE